MKTRDKAKELVEKFKPSALGYKGTSLEFKNAKESSIICVDEILKYQPYDVYSIEQCNNVQKYWEEVKQEINQL